MVLYKYIKFGLHEHLLYRNIICYDCLFLGDFFYWENDIELSNADKKTRICRRLLSTNFQGREATYIELLI